MQVEEQQTLTYGVQHCVVELVHPGQLIGSHPERLAAQPARYQGGASCGQQQGNERCSQQRRHLAS